MSARKRNLAILLVMGALVALSVLVIVPGSPLSQQTRLGLDLKGGVELVYQGRPTPQVPKVTPAAIDDAITTIRKRTDALGVSEPEIQRAGSDQISIGLPAVKNAERAEQQVGTTAQLQFYDWEPNVFGDPGAPVVSLFQAVQTAAKAKPSADKDDIPPDGASAAIKRRFGDDKDKIEQHYDRKNDTGGNKYYLFGPNDQIIRPGQSGAAQAQEPGGKRNDATAFFETCAEIAEEFEGDAPRQAQRGKSGAKPAKNTACPATMSALADKGAGPPAGTRVIQVPRGIVVVKAAEERGSLGYWILEDDSELSGADIKNPEQNTDPQTNEPIVSFDFTDKGRKAFARATKREADRGAEQIVPPGTPKENTFQRFAIALDNQIVSLATVSYIDNPEGIDGGTGAQINGIGSLKETQDLAENLRIGALPINLKLISKTQVSATLGKQALDQGLIAGAAGLLLTLTFLILFFRALGVIAGVTLVAYALMLFALVKLIPITLTLPGIAGMILTLGVAADANIVIFERVKEEARAGRSIPAAISVGYAKALRTIIDANVVTLFVAFILFMLATAGVKGFAFTLLIGTLTSLFTAVLATQAILSSISRWKFLRSNWALRLGSKDRQMRFDYTGWSNWFFSMSGLILAAGAIAISVFSINFGIDFTSGTRITTPLEQSASVEQVREALDPLGYADAEVQTVQDPELGDNVVQISTGKLDPARVNAVEQALDERFGVQSADFSASSVGPTFGQEIARTAVIAIIASLFVISLYIGLRFEFKFAVPVLIALAHDLLITAGVYALFDREVTTSTVAALLTILGYSLYDTIIVFDRIRENVPRMPRATFSQIVNRSMSEVIVRSLATSLSTLLPITALMLFGGETLQDFGFALLVGVASGTYSSVFIAGPVLVHWKEREQIWRRRTRLVREENGGVVPPYADVQLGDDGGEGDRRQADTPRPAVARDRTAVRDRAAARRRAAEARGKQVTRAPRGMRAGRPEGSAGGAEAAEAADGGDGRASNGGAVAADGDGVARAAGVDDLDPDRAGDGPVGDLDPDGAGDGPVDDGDPDGAGDGGPGGGVAVPGGTAGDGDKRPAREPRSKSQPNRKRRKHGRR